MSDKKSDFGLIGLAVMGQNLVLNVESRGSHVSVYNRTTATTDEFIAKHPGKKLVGSKTLEEFVQSLATPRKIQIMVKAGAPVDAVIEQLIPLLDKDDITGKLAEMIAAGAEVRTRWITDGELAAQPGLVRTMSVKPPMGTGRVRLVEIVGYDLQPCGGTHVRATNEIGAVRVTQIEKKGRQNRRVRIAFA